MNKPLVSVVIPVYNTGKSAKNLILKLLKDQYQNLEIITIDDGSKDNSLETLKSIKDKRIKVLHQKNQGVSSARNYGIKESTGDFIIFIDSDDEISQTFITKMVSAMKSDISMVTTGVKYVRVKSGDSQDLWTNPLQLQKSHESFKSYIMRLLYQDGRMYSSSNKIYDNKTIKENGLLYDTKMVYGEDTKFVLDYLKIKKGKLEFILEPLYIYYFGTKESAASKESTNWKNWQKCYKNLKKWVGNNPSKAERLWLKKVYFHWWMSCIKSKIRSMI